MQEFLDLFQLQIVLENAHVERVDLAPRNNEVRDVKVSLDVVM